MADHSYNVEVQTDFLQRITKAKPIPALAEFIWNSLDADATSVDVITEFSGLGVMSAVRVTDNGIGMEFAEAPELFRKLGGSWKRPGGITRRDGRFLHGQDGRGRFKAFSLGRVAEWQVTYDKGGNLFSFKILITEDNMRQVVISDEVRDKSASHTGVTLTLSELHKDFKSLTSDSGVQELTEFFALYLTDYKAVSVSIDGSRINPGDQIASQKNLPLDDITSDGASFPASVEVIEWRAATSRTLYLCNQKGFPLARAERRFHIGPYHFTAYLKSKYVEKLQAEGVLELFESNPALNDAIRAAQEALRKYFRERAAQDARSVVDDWKQEDIYPYPSEVASPIEKVERQVFDIVAVNVAQYLPDFDMTPAKNKAFHLRLLRQAIEKSPEELQLILGEVLKLPKRTLEEMAELLRDVSLSAMISAAKVVTDRLKFVVGLESILFDSEMKKRLKERSQLHKIIAENCWLFGEEYNLSVSDRSLTEVLVKHRALLKDEIAIDRPVKHISKERGIIDLMLSRAIRRHRANELTHLVVELKAPKVQIDRDEITQIEEYAISVKKDDRFKGVATTWVFWVISDAYGDYADHRMTSKDGSKDGKISDDGNMSIWVKTWAQVLDENRSRLQFFQERLDFEASKEDSLQYLHERYARFLQGVLEDSSDQDPVADNSDDESAGQPG